MITWRRPRRPRRNSGLLHRSRHRPAARTTLRSRRVPHLRRRGREHHPALPVSSGQPAGAVRRHRQPRTAHREPQQVQRRIRRGRGRHHLDHLRHPGRSSRHQQVHPRQHVRIRRGRASHRRGRQRAERRRHRQRPAALRQRQQRPRAAARERQPGQDRRRRDRAVRLRRQCRVYRHPRAVRLLYPLRNQGLGRLETTARLRERLREIRPVRQDLRWLTRRGRQRRRRRHVRGRQWACRGSRSPCPDRRRAGHVHAHRGQDQKPADHRDRHTPETGLRHASPHYGHATKK